MNNPFTPGPDGGTHVLKALANVRSQISPFIEKNAENKHHKYTYTDELALIASTRAAMVEHNLMLVPTETSNHNYENNGKMYVDTFTMHGVWISLVDGSTVNIALRVSGADSLDKGAYKADTGFIKYAIWKTFNIATGDDAERDEYSSLSSNTSSTKPEPAAEKPSRRRVKADPEPEEEQPTRSRRAKKEDVEEPEEEPKPSRRAKKEDVEEEPKPSRRRRAKAEPEPEDDEEDDEPPFEVDEKPKEKPKAKAAKGDEDPYGIGLSLSDIEEELEAMNEEEVGKNEYIQFINTQVRSITNPALRSKFRKETAPILKRFIG